MAAVDIHLGKDSYTVEIRRGLLEDTGRKIRRLTDAEKIAVVTDDHVGPLYGDRFRKILEDAGFTVRIITIPAGETSKNLSVFGDVLNAMADFEMTRKDALVTLSGGVPGDLGGYAAASYMRGIPFFQVPTTILAQIDSSVGGKVAVDLPAGKNLAGAFYQPKGVFIDPNLLKTLPSGTSMMDWRKRSSTDALAIAGYSNCLKPWTRKRIWKSTWRKLFRRVLNRKPVW